MIVASAFLTIDDALDRLECVQDGSVAVDDLSALVLMTITQIAADKHFVLAFVGCEVDAQTVREVPFWSDLCKQYAPSGTPEALDTLANALVVAVNTVKSIIDIACMYNTKISALLDEKGLLREKALSGYPWHILRHTRWTCTNIDAGIRERFANGGGFTCPMCERGDCYRAIRYNLVYMGRDRREEILYVCRDCAPSWPIVWRLLHVLSYFDDDKQCGAAAQRLSTDLATVARRRRVRSHV